MIFDFYNIGQGVSLDPETTFTYSLVGKGRREKSVATRQTNQLLMYWGLWGFMLDIQPDMMLHWFLVYREGDMQILKKKFFASSCSFGGVVSTKKSGEFYRVLFPRYYG